MLDTTSIFIKRKTEELGLSQGLLIVYSDNRISQARLSQALAGGSPLRNEDGLALKLLIQELEDLAATSPTPVDWKDTERVFEALEARRQAHEVIREERILAGIGD